ncbi:MAG: ATP-binding protein [Synergistaceae bacterium]|nr:ATP-binding protein [Synergistaceae bacterium]
MTKSFDPLSWSDVSEEVPLPGVEVSLPDDRGRLPYDGEAESFGVVAAPSSTDALIVDVLAEARHRALQGRWVVVPFRQEGERTFAVGQVRRISMENDLFSGATSRAVITASGSLPPSASEDLYRAELSLSAVFALRGPQEQVVPSLMGTVPPSGSPAYLVSDDFLQGLLSRSHRDLFYLGTAYGPTGRNLLLPTWIRHFRKGPGGAGDTYHMGIFGRTGSGKSVLAKMVLTGFARHDGTSLFVFDPQGEFSRDLGGSASDQEGFLFDWGRVATRKFGKRVQAVPLRNLVLDSWDLFEDVIGKALVFQWLGYPRGEKRDLAAEQLARELRERHIGLAELGTDEAFEAVGAIVSDEVFVKRVYMTDDSVERHLRKARDYWSDPVSRRQIERLWKAMTLLFDDRRKGTVSVSRLVDDVAGGDRIVVVNLSREGLDRGVSIASGGADMIWDEEIQGLIVWRLLEALRKKGEATYLDGGRLNVLVVLDEAHRFVPRGNLEGTTGRVRDLLVTASRETRKYGLGWLFVSQTLASLHPEVIGQMRALFVGFGLTGGGELAALRDLAGGDGEALAVYQRFPDPQSAPSDLYRTFNYMLLGPLSPLAFSGQPLFLAAFPSPQAFLEANGLEVGP